MNNREIKFRIWNNKIKNWVHGPGQECNLFGEMVLLGGFMKGVNVEAAFVYSATLGVGGTHFNHLDQDIDVIGNHFETPELLKNQPAS